MVWYHTIRTYHTIAYGTQPYHTYLLVDVTLLTFHVTFRFLGRVLLSLEVNDVMSDDRRELM